MILTFNPLFVGEWIASVMDCITYGDISLPFSPLFVGATNVIPFLNNFVTRFGRETMGIHFP